MEYPTEDRSLMAITERAAEWYVAHRSGPLSPADREAFVAWLQASPLHVREYLSIAAAAQEFASAEPLPDAELNQLLADARQESGDTSNVISLNALRPQPVARSVRPVRHWAMGLAASALLAVGVLWFMRYDGLALFAAGETYEIVGEGRGVWRLSDGSLLHLNSHSSARVRFSSSERLVELQRGQALFEVAHHSPLKFRVAAGYADVVAVGTRFEVKREAQSDRVTVVEGTVSVQPGAAANAVRATAGQRVSVDATRGVGKVEVADAGEVYAWVQHPMEFEQRPLASVVQELNRYALLPINIEGPALRQLPITGVFNLYDVESFLAFLRQLPEVQVVAGETAIQVRLAQGRSASR